MALSPTWAADHRCQQPETQTPIAAISLDEKIGQMLLVGFRGNYLESSNPIVDAISNLHIGGVILFDNPDPSIGNIGSPEQLRSLTTSLQALTPTRLFVASTRKAVTWHGSIPATASHSCRPSNTWEASAIHPHAFVCRRHRIDPARTWHQPQPRAHGGPQRQSQ